MPSRATKALALRIAKEGHPSPARANDFGWSRAEYKKRLKMYEWAIRILVRKRCGAKRRSDGRPCKAMCAPGRPRCRWHGGLSTGPKTPDGRKKALLNLKQFKSSNDSGSSSKAS